MSMRKHVVRTMVLGFVGTALAFAHPTDVRIDGATGPSELRQEEAATVPFRVRRAMADIGSVQASTLALEEEMRQEKQAHKAFRLAARAPVPPVRAPFDSVLLDPGPSAR